jgi:hypothetical protein
MLFLNHITDLQTRPFSFLERQRNRREKTGTESKVSRYLARNKEVVEESTLNSYQSMMDDEALVGLSSVQNKGQHKNREKKRGSTVKYNRRESVGGWCLFFSQIISPL